MSSGFRRSETIARTVSQFGTTQEDQNGSYAFFERDGNQLNLGFSPGPWDANEEKLLQLNYWGFKNPANNIQINGRLQTGTTENTDITGELQVSSNTSATYSFTGMCNVHPDCALLQTSISELGIA